MVENIVFRVISTNYSFVESQMSITKNKGKIWQVTIEDSTITTLQFMYNDFVTLGLGGTLTRVSEYTTGALASANHENTDLKLSDAAPPISPPLGSNANFKLIFSLDKL